MLHSKTAFLAAAALVLIVILSAGLVPASTAQDTVKPIRALLVIGGCCHDYAKQKEILTKGISARANVQWVIAYDPDKGTKHINPVYNKPNWSEGFDVVVHDRSEEHTSELQSHSFISY